MFQVLLDWGDPWEGGANKVTKHYYAHPVVFYSFYSVRLMWGAGGGDHSEKVFK